MAAFPLHQIATHAFLTHTWVPDSLGRDNHARVGRVNEGLKARGLVTWFDADRMNSSILNQMVGGIEFTNFGVVIITDAYREK